MEFYKDCDYNWCPLKKAPFISVYEIAWSQSSQKIRKIGFYEDCDHNCCHLERHHLSMYMKSAIMIAALTKQLKNWSFMSSQRYHLSVYTRITILEKQLEKWYFMRILTIIIVLSKNTIYQCRWRLWSWSQSSQNNYDNEVLWGQRLLPWSSQMTSFINVCEDCESQSSKNN